MRLEYQMRPVNKQEVKKKLKKKKELAQAEVSNSSRDYCVDV